MEYLEGLLRFLNSYPGWAKALALGGVAVTVVVLVFAPRIPPLGTAGPAENSGALLTIEAVTLFPETEETAPVRVMAIVNGTTYHYPSVGKIEWVEVGSDMPSHTFQLPPANQYQVRFELERKRANTGQIERMVSQQVQTLGELPTSGVYRLYKTYRDSEADIHGQQIGGVVRYSVRPGR